MVVDEGLEKAWKMKEEWRHLCTKNNISIKKKGMRLEYGNRCKMLIL